MSIDLSAIHLSPLAWLALAIAVILIAFGIVQYFFRHLLHLFFRGCGAILIVILVLYVLHLLKVF